jgi:hypothetical protein
MPAAVVGTEFHQHEVGSQFGQPVEPAETLVRVLSPGSDPRNIRRRSGLRCTWVGNALHALSFSRKSGAEGSSL